LAEKERQSAKAARSCQPGPGAEKKFFVGSGVVEAGSRTVMGERTKQSGLRWSVREVSAIIALRRCIMYSRFEDFWASRTR
jgi:hypothetical protein